MKRSLSTSVIVSAFLFGVVAAGCSSDGRPAEATSTAAPDQRAERSAARDSSSALANPAVVPGVEGQLPNVNQESSVAEAAPGAEAKVDGKKGLRPLDFPYEVSVPAEAEVVPACVVRGSAATLKVSTEPEAAIGYQAVYQGNEGGGPPPFGEGHGGNDKGQVSPSGTWESTWVVSPQAPVGKARVDVVIGWEGQWGYEDPFFFVAAAAKDCP